MQKKEVMLSIVQAEKGSSCLVSSKTRDSNLQPFGKEAFVLPCPLVPSPSVADLSFIHFSGYFLVCKVPVSLSTEKKAKEIYSLILWNWHLHYKPFFTQKKGHILWKVFNILQRSTKSICERKAYLVRMDHNWEEQKTDC